jgi:alpha-ribazole phosphatase
MEIHLVRHIAPAVEKGICYGQTDVPLPPEYPVLHQTVLTKLEGPYQKIYSSPLQRCRLLAEATGLPTTYDPRLREVNFGQWENRAWNDLDQEELNRWMYNYIGQAPPGGESLTQVVARFQEFLNELPVLNKVLIITHAGIIRSAFHLLNNLPLDKVMMEKADYGTVYKFKVNN